MILTLYVAFFAIVGFTVLGLAVSGNLGSIQSPIVVYTIDVNSCANEGTLSPVSINPTLTYQITNTMPISKPLAADITLYNTGAPGPSFKVPAGTISNEFTGYSYFSYTCV